MFVLDIHIRLYLDVFNIQYTYSCNLTKNFVRGDLISCYLTTKINDFNRPGSYHDFLGVKIICYEGSEERSWPHFFPGLGQYNYKRWCQCFVRSCIWRRVFLWEITRKRLQSFKVTMNYSSISFYLSKEKRSSSMFSSLFAEQTLVLPEAGCYKKCNSRHCESLFSYNFIMFVLNMLCQYKYTHTNRHTHIYCIMWIIMYMDTSILTWETSKL